MNDYESLKTRVKIVIAECESLMEFFDTFLQTSKNGKSASVKITQTSRNGWRDWELLLPGSNHWELADIWRKRTK